MHALTAGAGEARLIGSMAEPDAEDAFSDIDIRWTVPPGETTRSLRALRPTLQQVGEVESLRVDPEPRPGEILVFVRFLGWPLWWRVDLEVHSPGSTMEGVPGADPWSPYESACMGVVVTLKALARGRPDAESLFARARQRVGATDVAGDWRLRIDSLLDRIAAESPRAGDLVSRTRQLSREVLGG